MGWTVLYVAFGVVALWLLGEVLLQYKARLRWRLLAFTGFSAVVAGAVIPSIVVIGIGIAAFATGQTYVTLSYRRGFEAGWALGHKPGTSGRRRDRAPEADPTLHVSGLEAADPAAGERADEGRDTGTFELPTFGSPGFPAAEAGAPGAGVPGAPGVPGAADDLRDLPEDATSVFQPGPLPDETAQFADVYASYDGYGGTVPPTADPVYGAYDSYSGYDGRPGPDVFTGQGEYDDGQAYASYSDPYIAFDGNNGYQQVGYDAYGGYGYDAYASYDGGQGYDPRGYDPQGYAQPGYPPQGYDPLSYDPPGYDPLGPLPEAAPYAPDAGGHYPGAGYPDPYGTTGVTGTAEAADGLWFPQQRDPNAPLPAEQPQQYPYANDPSTHGYYYDEQRGGY